MKIPKDKLRRLEIFSVITVGIIIIAMFIFPNVKVPALVDNAAIPKITGYVPADMFAQNLNLEFTESSKYILSTASEQAFTMTSLRLDGVVEGDGVVKVTLVDGNTEYLIYSNVKEDLDKGNLITGMAVANPGNLNAQNSIALELTSAGKLPALVTSVEEGYKAISGPFTNECVDTCYINLPFSKDTSYDFLVEIEDNTKLTINKIVYTIAS